MQLFQVNEFESWDRIYRANFINSLTGFKSASLIGTINESGQTNLAIFSSIVHIGSNPALVGFINRPLTTTSHTLRNIQQTELYTINQFTGPMVKQAHQTSAKYPEEVSEFSAVGLTPQFLENIRAPFVKESRVKFALKLQEVIPIKLNDTFLVIGKIISICLDAEIVSPDGFLSLEQSGTVCSNGSDTYYSTSFLERLPYAKP